VIVRILGEGQYEVPDGERASLDALDDALVAAVDAGDEGSFVDALVSVTTEVRRVGRPVPEDLFAPSDLVLPFPDASLQETKRLLEEGVESGEDDQAADRADMITSDD